MERFRVPIVFECMLLLLLLLQYFELGSSLSDDGKALLKFRESVEVDPYSSLSDWIIEEDVHDPCLWTGVTCEDGRVVSLNLGNLRLKGTLTPDLRKLIHLKRLILNNNSFYGIIPREIGELQRLEVLDLAHNNLHGPLPSELDGLVCLKDLVLQDNQLLRSMFHIKSPLVSTSCSTRKNRGRNFWKHLQGVSETDGSVSLDSAASPGIQTPRHPQQPPSSPTTSMESSSPLKHEASPPPPKAVKVTPPPPPPPHHHQKRYSVLYLVVGVGVGVLVLGAILVIVCWKCRVIIVVKPCSISLSGQLQKAFVTGLPSLKRHELEAACEGFSNEIGSQRDGILYKGTLPSGVEIAVSVIKSDGNWTRCSQAQFRQKIMTLSKVNHKNFVNLLGYCEEEKSPSRMLVFEYAPNGTLFEHLHVKEAEHLNWAARSRIAMGVAYCLDHMYRLNPPVMYRNVDSNSILLTEDYAAKVADLELWSDTTCIDTSTRTSGLLAYQTEDHESVAVHKFGILLLELITGRLPYSDESGGMVNWASDFLNGNKALEDMIDPSLQSFSMDQVHPICDVIRMCLNPDPKGRLLVKDVVAKLRKITAETPEGVSPKLSPLWWAELEMIPLTRG